MYYAYLSLNDSFPSDSVYTWTASISQSNSPGWRSTSVSCNKSCLPRCPNIIITQCKFATLCSSTTKWYDDFLSEVTWIVWEQLKFSPSGVFVIVVVGCSVVCGGVMVVVVLDGIIGTAWRRSCEWWSDCWAFLRSGTLTTFWCVGVSALIPKICSVSMCEVIRSNFMLRWLLSVSVLCLVQMATVWYCCGVLW